MQELTAELARGRAEEAPAAGAAVPAGVWREHLKTMDYALRGGVSLLGDRGTPGEDDDTSGEHLRDDCYLAVGGQGLSRLLSAEDGPRLYAMVAGLRAEVARFLRSSLEACVQEKGPADVKSAKLAVRLSQRVACTRGAKAHETRRKGSAIAAFKSQQREIGRDAARKMLLNLARQAAAKGDTVAAARHVLMGGSGGVQACPRALSVAQASLQHGKRLAVAPRALAYAARDAARPSRGSAGGAAAAAAAPWSAASTVLDRYRSLFSALVAALVVRVRHGSSGGTGRGQPCRGRVLVVRSRSCARPHQSAFPERPARRGRRGRGWGGGPPKADRSALLAASDKEHEA